MSEDLSNGLPVAVPHTDIEAVDSYLKNTPRPKIRLFARPEIRLLGVIKERLFKKRPRYRVIMVDGKYFAQVRSWGIWWWITHSGRDELFSRDMCQVQDHSCVEWARHNINDYKERHQPRPKPMVVEEYE